MIEGLELSQRMSKVRNLDTKSLQIGYLIFDEKLQELKFQDAFGKFHDIKKVQFVTGDWNSIEGTKHLPKPYIQNESGNITENGDNLLYTFINSYEENIVVIGSLQNIATGHSQKDLVHDLKEIDNLRERTIIRDNRQRHLRIIDSGNGILTVSQYSEESGQVIIKSSGKKGDIKLESDGKFIINNRDKEGGLSSQVFIDNSKIKIVDKHGNKAEITEKGISLKDKSGNKIETTEKGTEIESKHVQIGNGADITLKKILSDLLSAIQKMTVITPSGASSPNPLNWAEFQLVVDDINTFMELK